MTEKMILRLFNRNKITVAGETFEPEPLNLEETMNLTLLLLPYIGMIESHFAEFERILKDTSGNRPQLLSTFLTAMVDEIKPADFTRMFVILLRKEPEWFAGVRAKELVEALPVLDRVNDFGGLIGSIRGLGLTVGYKDA